MKTKECMNGLIMTTGNTWATAGLAFTTFRELDIVDIANHVVGSFEALGQALGIVHPIHTKDELSPAKEFTDAGGGRLGALTNGKFRKTLGLNPDGVGVRPDPPAEDIDPAIALIDPIAGTHEELHEVGAVILRLEAKHIELAHGAGDLLMFGQGTKNLR